MSIRLMADVWKVDLEASEKLVLLALADSANDEGLCWPSIATLATKCSKSVRTVQAMIKALEAGGHLTRNEVSGRGCKYLIHPRSSCTPAKSAPVQKTASTPAKSAPHPRKICTQTIIEPSRTVIPSPEGAVKVAGGKTVLPADWQPTPLDDLPPRARDCARQWTPASYATHGEAFVSYWRSTGRKMGDWRLTWANRIVALHSQVMRDQKYGNAPANDGVTASTGQWDAITRRKVTA